MKNPLKLATNFIPHTVGFLMQTPAHKTAPPNQSSLGTQGLLAPQQVNVETGSAFGAPIREVVPELATQFQRSQTFNRMKNDSTTDVSMRVAKTPVLGADFYMEPYSVDPLDQITSKFCWDNLFESLSAPFCNSLTDVLEMYEDGFSSLELVFEERQWVPNIAGANTKNYTMLKKLGVRPASTVTKINYDDNGGPVSIDQVAIRADGKTDEVNIPIDKLMIFTFGRKGGDLTGKSLLRTAYPHWYYKTHFYKIDAIQKERHGLGVLLIRLLAGFTDADKKAARTMGRNMRTNEETFMLLPPNVDAEFAELHGNLVNVLESANHHDIRILLNVMAQFLLLGVEQSGGGRATGGTQTDMFMKSLRYVANLICDVINMYLIPKLVVYNFKTTNFPKLKVRNIGETRDLQMLGAALANLVARGAITMDDPTEQWVRQAFDIPSKLEPRPTELPIKPGQKGDVKNNGGQGNVGKPPNAFASSDPLELE